MHRRPTTFAWLVLVGGSFVLSAGCASKKPQEPPAPVVTAEPTIRPASSRIEATDEAIEEAQAEMKRSARKARREWEGKSFEEFERSVRKEPFEGGKYIVSGDIAVADRKQLEEIFEKQIKQDAQSSKTGSLIVQLDGGEDAVWNSTQKKQLTYCVSDGFGTRKGSVVTDMETATGAWENVAAVDFVHVASQDGGCDADNANVVFDVRPVNVNGQYLARAFFPNDPRWARNVLIDESSFQLDPNGKLTLTGILRHELGHTLGWRHEHTRPESGTCFEDSNWRPLTDYDRFSVMHYPQCNGGGDWSLTLTALDQNGAACVYGAAPGFQIDTSICGAAPEPPPDAPCRAGNQVFDHQRVARGEEKEYGPFSVSPGTLFEAEMVGDGSSPGDPDVYVQFGTKPKRNPPSYACRPYLTGPDETCSLDVPAGKTQAFVMVHGYTAGAYRLTVDFTTP